MKLDRAEAEVLLNRLRGRRVVVLGDLMLDEYLFGEVSRISPEAPVPIVHVRREKAVLGGAANVVSNLRAIGAEPLVIGTLREDAAGLRLLQILKGLGVASDAIVRDGNRPTIIKTRVIGQQQQMLRIDREELDPLSEPVVEALQIKLASALEEASALIVSDYAKGVISAPLMDAVRECCAKRGIPWIVDPKPSHRELYRGATLMTPNTKELTELSNKPSKSDAEVEAAGRALSAELGISGLLVTRSEKGMALFAPESGRVDPWLIPTEAREVFDVSGAGDTVIAVFSAAVAAGANWKAAAMLANAAAGVVVGKIGTATASPAEILAHYQEQRAN
ncbi:MAG TPA: D-glycero-beta-D-manno-heptose-7-phosphate kinase [Holophaga sp.]|jgi:D-beta-D-heptose 7-phosphate kinase/D-beta-D-heptose 1-phosphate adenosyltransferase|nr:D-glycero-beta-D-manno-heptose-7-phosphate kinase [Holophaga sp.]